MTSSTNSRDATPMSPNWILGCVIEKNEKLAMELVFGPFTKLASVFLDGLPRLLLLVYLSRSRLIPWSGNWSSTGCFYVRALCSGADGSGR